MLMNNGLNFYIKNQIVYNDDEELTDFYVKKNTPIVWNDNEWWAEFLCKKRTDRFSWVLMKNVLNCYVKEEHADCVQC